MDLQWKGKTLVPRDITNIVYIELFRPSPKNVHMARVHCYLFFSYCNSRYYLDIIILNPKYRVRKVVKVSREST